MGWLKVLVKIVPEGIPSVPFPMIIKLPPLAERVALVRTPFCVNGTPARRRLRDLRLPERTGLQAHAIQTRNRGESRARKG